MAITDCFFIFCKQLLNKDVHRSLTINKAFIILLKTLKMNISIGNDHAGPLYKKEIVTHLESKGYVVFNHGTDTENSVDYPDFIHPVAEDISSKKSSLGIIICGSGNGASMTANKHQNIRAALCWSAEIVSLARQHNDANILSIPARFVSMREALEMVDVFITTAFEGGRHQKRVEKIACS